MRIVIDCDPGGVPGANVDDFLALAYALASPHLHLQAVWTVAGNATSSEGWVAATDFLARAGTTIAVRRGAENPLVPPTASQRTDTSPAPPPTATSVLASDLADADALVCLGPLTNAAAVLAEHPRALEGLPVWAMAGSWDPPVDTNARLDIPALARMLHHPHLVLVPLTLTRHLALPLPTWRTAALDGLGRLVAPRVDAWLNHPQCRRPPGGLWIHDVVALAGPEPGMLTVSDASVDLAENGSLCAGSHRVRMATGASLKIIARLSSALSHHNLATEQSGPSLRDPARLL